MNHIKLCITVLFIAFLLAGCQDTTSIPETIIPSTEMILQTETRSESEPSEAEATKSSVDQYEAYQWMINLKAEEVAYVEFLNFSDPLFPSRR